MNFLVYFGLGPWTGEYFVSQESRDTTKEGSIHLSHSNSATGSAFQFLGETASNAFLSIFSYLTFKATYFRIANSKPLLAQLTNLATIPILSLPNVHSLMQPIQSPRKCIFKLTNALKSHQPENIFEIFREK